jgi:hypothetical protein
MAKKRYSLYLSTPLARKFDLVAQQRHGSKSALFEDAIRTTLEPEPIDGADESLGRSLNELKKSVAAMARDLAIVAESLALYVRYFLTMTPPLPQSERQAAQMLGRERFQVFVAQVGRRLAGDHRLVSEVLETIAANNPDLFATAMDQPCSRGPPPRLQVPTPRVRVRSSIRRRPARRVSRVRSTSSIRCRARGRGEVVLLPRIIRCRDAHAYLGMDRNRFNREVRRHVTEIPIGIQGIGFDRLELDAWLEEYKSRNGRPGRWKGVKSWDARGSPASSCEAGLGTSTSGSSGGEFARALARLGSKKQKKCSQGSWRKLGKRRSTA